MIRLDIKQGTPEWSEARASIPTASGMGRIISPTGKPSKQADDYLNKLLAEWFTGETDSFFKSKYIQDGHRFEPDARAAYQFEKDVVVEQTGVIYKDEKRLLACSPDGLPPGDIGLEIKCPKASTFVGYIWDGDLPEIYKPQVQCSMLITEFEHWDFMVYHWKFKPMIIRIDRDETYCETMRVMLESFTDDMLERREWLSRYGLEEYVEVFDDAEGFF